jgi:hypothetical protein
MTDEVRTDQEATPAPGSRARTQPLNKFAARSAEIKKHKRKAHRRRINASNRPG